MKSPRGAFVNLDDYQKRRFEFLRGAKELTQEMIKIVTSTLTNAVTAGQRIACIQTLEITTQYSYSRAEPHSRLSFVLHDMYTFKPLQARINLAARPLELVQWVQSKGYRVICVTHPLTKDAISPFVNLYAIAMPEVTTNELINYPFAPSPNESEWMTKVISAVRVGAMHSCICLLHVERDYSSVISTNYPCTNVPRDALTMQPIEGAETTFFLHERWSHLIAWVAQMPRAWTLAIVDEKYAYFVVLLQPSSDLF